MCRISLFAFPFPGFTLLILSRCHPTVAFSSSLKWSWPRSVKLGSQSGMGRGICWIRIFSPMNSLDFQQKVFFQYVSYSKPPHSPIFYKKPSFWVGRPNCYKGPFNRPWNNPPHTDLPWDPTGPSDVIFVRLGASGQRRNDILNVFSVWFCTHINQNMVQSVKIGPHHKKCFAFFPRHEGPSTIKFQKCQPLLCKILSVLFGYEDFIGVNSFQKVFHILCSRKGYFQQPVVSHLRYVLFTFVQKPFCQNSACWSFWPTTFWKGCCRLPPQNFFGNFPQSWPKVVRLTPLLKELVDIGDSIFNATFTCLRHRQ